MLAVVHYIIMCMVPLVVWLCKKKLKNLLCWSPSSSSGCTPKGNKLPGPEPWPIIGSLHLLGEYPQPYQAFTALSHIYGDIYKITLGTTPCVVVNNYKLIKEVLITKGGDFGDRPNFKRFDMLFGGDRSNSLALCDWSALQKTRRALARSYCSPRVLSTQYSQVNYVGGEELKVFLDELNKLPTGQPCDVKPTVLRVCANMFTKYMCSTSFSYEDKDFQTVVRLFDEIFWEINQGYAVDFLPWLWPFYIKHMNKLSARAQVIRDFILDRVIEKHIAKLGSESPKNDFTDALLSNLGKDGLGWLHLLFELEDFLGGHSAIGNLVMVTLAAVVQHPEVAERIQEEVDSVTKGERCPDLNDKSLMPYTEATIWETLRTASSPIVPHVASTDTSIAGYEIPKGTVIFINNYELNLGKDYWEEPEKFKPERFLTSDGGTIIKPSHFIPFSTGKRTCIGQRLVQCFSFMILATLLQNYNIHTDETVSVDPGCVAVPPDCFKLTLRPRQISLK